MIDNETRAKAIKNLLATEEYLLSEIQNPTNNNNNRSNSGEQHRAELYNELKQCQTQRHSLIKELYPTACPEPLHRAVSLLKEESTLESLLLKNLENNQTKTADRIADQLNEIRRMRQKAISEADRCSVAADSNKNRCYSCEQKGAVDKTNEVVNLINQLEENRRKYQNKMQIPTNNQKNINISTEEEKEKNNKTNQINRRRPRPTPANDLWQGFLKNLLS